MCVVILLFIVFKIIVILKINIYNISVKEKIYVNLLSSIFVSLVCVSFNFFFLESYFLCWLFRYIFVLNICKNYFFF